MKKQWKSFLCGVFAVLVLVGTVSPAAATVGNKTAVLEYNNIKVTLDSAPVNLVDVNGNPVEPFIIGGTTYLPIRALSNAFGLNVDWDGATQTVILTHPAVVQPRSAPTGPAPGTVGNKTATLEYNDIKVTLDGALVNLVDVNGNPVKPFIIGGTTYLPIRAISNAFGLNVDWDGATQTVILTHPNTTQPEPGPTLEPTPEPTPTPEPLPSMQVPPSRDPNRTVYVSTRSHTIHSVHDCSGMRNYREMKLSEAEARGYKYCDNCW